MKLIIIIINTYKKLLLLKNYLENNEYNKAEIADLLELSDKQLIRQFKKWEENGFLKYCAGQGRGHLSGIKFIRDVEYEFVMKAIQNVERYSAAVLQEILELPISEQSKAEILSAAGVVINKQPPKEEQSITLNTDLPETIDPLEITETSAPFIRLITDRLYSVVNGDIVSQLVSFDEWKKDKLIVNLKRNLRYSDGSYLFAEDVVSCLKKLFAATHCQQIKEIEVTGLYSFAVHVTNRSLNIFSILASDAASIYKMENDSILGTGKYYLSLVADNEIALKLNPFIIEDYPFYTAIKFTNKKLDYRYNYFDFMEYTYIKEGKDIRISNKKPQLLAVNAHLVGNGYLEENYSQYHITKLKYSDFLLSDFKSLSFDVVLIYDASTHPCLASFYQQKLEIGHSKGKWQEKLWRNKWKIAIPDECKNIVLSPDGAIDVSLVVKGE